MDYERNMARYSLGSHKQLNLFSSLFVVWCLVPFSDCLDHSWWKISRDILIFVFDLRKLKITGNWSLL